MAWEGEINGRLQGHRLPKEKAESKEKPSIKTV